MEEIHGHIERITFQSSESGFTVARLKEVKKRELTIIVGTMPSVQVGETIRCKGFWKNDKNYGIQFTVTEYEVEQPTSLNGIQKYLGSGLIKGIGSVFAERIVEYYGKKTLEIIDSQPERLLEVSGIGKKRVERIRECWDEQKAIREVMIFLQSYGVTPTFAQKIFKQYKEESIAVIEENPYQLARDVYGIGFKTADTIAGKMGVSKDSDTRIDAGIEYVLSELSNDGHTCFPKEPFLQRAEELLAVKEDLIEPRLEAIQEEGRIILDEMTRNDEEQTFIWLKSLFLSEFGIAKELNRIKMGMSILKEVKTNEAILWAEKEQSIQLADNQKIAVAESLKQKLHIITGGPGTGKSTITNVILAISKKLTGRILLAAPTGRAAKRLSSITGMEALTIHSLLEFDFKIMNFRKNRDEPLDADLIIIDEASMIDTSLMYSLLKAIPSHARVLFVGDIDQLPSVGAGNVLRDLIDSKVIPVTQLTEIFRQAAHSKIITNAHKINNGEFPDVRIDKKSDFFFIEKNEQEDIAALIGDLVSTRLPKRYKFNPLKDIQVLSPMKRGLIGTRNLNELLQEKLNKEKAVLSKYGRNFRKGDKVMQLKNNYDKNVFNGDVGLIESIDYEEQEMAVMIDEELVIYEFSELDQLTLAYAISVHKYQGSECPCIIMPIHTTHYNLLFRNLLYTGITRGKSLVIVIGTRRALFIALKNNKVSQRFTGLKEALLV